MKSSISITLVTTLAFLASGLPVNAQSYDNQQECQPQKSSLRKFAEGTISDKLTNLNYSFNECPSKSTKNNASKLTTIITPGKQLDKQTKSWEVIPGYSSQGDANRI